MTRAQKLREAYFRLREEVPSLREDTRFEAKPWHTVGKTQVRYSDDGSKLLVYEIENDIEVCVIDLDSESRTYC